MRLALRRVWDHPQVTMTLSGMNSLEQISENAETASDALPESLTEAERKAVEASRASISKSYRVACTGCGYCIPFRRPPKTSLQA